MRSLDRTILLLAALLVAGHQHAQDASLVPELRRSFATASNDTLRADALVRICFNLIRSDPDSARLVGEQAMTLAKRINNPRALGDAHNNLGWLAAEQGQFARADSLLNIALSIFNRIGKPEYTSTTISNLGWLAEKKGDSVGALKRFQEALMLSEQAGDSATSSILLYSIGIAYRKIQDYPKAFENLQRSQRMERALHRRGKEANCTVALANTYREKGDTVAAVEAYTEAITIYSVLRDHQGWGITEENLGDLRSSAPRQALTHYLTALAHYDSIHSAIDKAYVLQRIGRSQLELGQLKEAEASMKEGLALSVDAGDPQLTLEYEMGLARLAAKKGDAEGAMRHFDRYTAMKDSLQGADTQRELARLRTEFETERTEKDNTILRAQNSEKSERLRRRDIQLFGSAVIGVLALLAALLFFRNFRQKRQHANVLEGLNKQLASSNAEITEINGLLEMKLLRSQMNPHFIYNCLNSAARMTQAGQSAEALAYLQGFARLLRMVLDQSVTDRISIDQELDFLRQYLKLEAHRLDHFTYEVNASRALLDNEVELLALLVQPFVENAIWHGLANKEGERILLVSFTEVAGQLQCEITDNGIGRTAAAALPHDGPQHRSLGMQLTSERIKLLARRMEERGSVTVEDIMEAGKVVGTHIRLRLPLHT
ncbi:MAG: tetratricopeptide repeat protein [Flavobacteriales bacterium]|nr:tetratricopeptide repeat protein [Flavobacteriales bacterium]